MARETIPPAERAPFKVLGIEAVIVRVECPWCSNHMNRTITQTVAIHPQEWKYQEIELALCKGESRMRPVSLKAVMEELKKLLP